MKSIMKNIISALLSVIFIVTLSLSAAASSIDSDVALDQRMIRENEANIQYSLLMNSYKHETLLRSSSNEKEIIYPDYYAGAYIDDTGELIVVVTTMSADIEEIRTATRNQSITISYAQNSYNDLVCLKECIEDKYDEYYSMYSNKVNEADQDLLGAVINFTGVGISERSNKLIVGLSSTEPNDIEMFEKYFVSSEMIVYEQSSHAVEESTSLYCGSAIYTVNGNGSIGYRCKIKKGNEYLRGFITAGHVTGNGEAIGVYTAPGLSPATKIGTVEAYKYSGNVDMAFVAIDSGYEIESATSNRVLSENYFTSIAEGKTIYMWGKSSNKEVQGEIESNSYSFTTSSGVKLTDCIKSNYPSEDGDSGGVVYAYINGSYCIVGIHHGVKSELLFWRKAITIKACNIYDTYDFYKY